MPVPPLTLTLHFCWRCGFSQVIPGTDPVPLPHREQQHRNTHGFWCVTYLTPLVYSHPRPDCPALSDTEFDRY